MTNKIDTVLKAITDRMAEALPSDTVKNPKLNVNSTSPVLFARSYPTEDPQCSTHIHGSINVITIHPKQQCNPHNDKPEEEEQEEKDDPENINTNPSLPPDPSVSFITKKNDDSHIKEPKVGENAGVGESEVEYFDIFPTRRNFTYFIDFMIIEDISSIMDPRLSQVVLGRPFVEISNKTHDPPEDLEREHTKSVYLRNEENKRRGVEYVMIKILGFYKECLELGPEYVTGITDKGGVTKFFKENEKKIFSEAGYGVRIYPDGIVIFDEKKLGSS
ncbi:hypothetical protein Tco_0302575 [Tanacetum coccineum]